MCNLLSANQFFDTLKPGTVRPRLFRGKNPGFAAGRALLTGRFFSFRLTGRHTCTYFWRGLAAKRDCASRARMRAATAFWPKPQKAAKALFDLPAPSEKRRQRFSTAPNRLGGNLFLLMWLECARPLFTLTPAACAFPAQAGRGIIAQPEPRRRNCPWQFRLPRVRKREKALFAGKIPVLRRTAKCRPAFWPARDFFLRECRRHSGWLPAIRRDDAADSSAAKPAYTCGEV